MKKNFKINEVDYSTNPMDRVSHNKGYTNLMDKSPGDNDDLQANIRSTDSDIEDAFAKVGMSSEIDFYPLVTMNQPFLVSFNFIKEDKKKVKYSPKTANIDRNEQKSYSCSIWLSPTIYKKLKNGESWKKEYRFKIVDSKKGVDKEDLEGSFLVFKPEEINVHEKTSNQIIPQLVKKRAYSVKLLKLQTSSVLNMYNILNEVISDVKFKPILSEFKKGTKFDTVFYKIKFTDIKIKGVKVKDDYGDSGDSSNNGLSYTLETNIEDAVKTQITTELNAITLMAPLTNEIIKLIEKQNSQVTVTNNKKKDIVSIKIGKVDGKSVYINIPYLNNGGNGDTVLSKLEVGDKFEKCQIAYAKPFDPIIKDLGDMDLKITEN